MVVYAGAMAALVACSYFPSVYDANILLERTASGAAVIPEDPPPYSRKPKRQHTEVSHRRRSHSHRYSNASEAHPACPACYYRCLRRILRAWVMKQRKPYTAITVQIDRLTNEQFDENDLGGLVDLIEVIRIQDTGPTEAARALRKKLKYGNMHRQLRALTILDGLIQNAGTRFQRTFADEPLLERLRIMPRDEMVDKDVRDKCNILYRQWAAAYRSTPGLERIATLYKQLPQTDRRPRPQQSKVIRETEADLDRDSPPSSPPPQSRSPPKPSYGSSSRPTPVPVTLTPTPSHSSSGGLFKSSKNKKNRKQKPFNLQEEKPQMVQAIAQASIASTNLLNALQLINRESQRVSENQEAVNRFETCKVLRRQILRYIQLVESDQWIGSLLSANDELVKALMAYEVMDKSIDDDSDSDIEYQAYKAAVAHSRSDGPDAAHQLAGLNLNENVPAKPPRPANLSMPPSVPVAASKKQVQEEESEPEEDYDENDPFGDQNAVKTPYVEKSQPTWRDV